MHSLSFLNIAEFHFYRPFCLLLELGLSWPRTPVWKLICRNVDMKSDLQLDSCYQSCLFVKSNPAVFFECERTCISSYSLCYYFISWRSHLTLLELQAALPQSQIVFKFSPMALPLLVQSQKLPASTRWSEIYALYMLIVETVNPWGGSSPGSLLKRDGR